MVGQTGHATISGAPKIRQDLALALQEPIGNDRFHLDWGSVLPEYIGMPITDETDVLVKAEVGRVLQQYMAVQQRDILQDSTDGQKTRYATSDVVQQVVEIQASVHFDTVDISVSLLTAAGKRVTVKRTVNLSG